MNDEPEVTVQDIGQVLGFILGILQTVHPQLRVNPSPAQAALLERVCGIQLGEDSPIVTPKPRLVM